MCQLLLLLCASNARTPAAKGRPIRAGGAGGGGSKTNRVEERGPSRTPQPARRSFGRWFWADSASLTPRPRPLPHPPRGSRPDFPQAPPAA